LSDGKTEGTLLARANVVPSNKTSAVSYGAQLEIWF
jgi:hypothetical protein